MMVIPFRRSRPELRAHGAPAVFTSSRAVVSALVCTMALGSLSASAQSQSATRPAAARPAVVSDTERVERALLAAEEAERYARLNRWRATYLAKSAWADLGTRCNPGNLRMFPRDTTPQQRDSIQALVEQMEFAVLSGGVGTKLNTPDTQRLLRVIVGWEAGIDRPNWDVLDEPARGAGTGAAGRGLLRPAIATGLTGEVPDPQGPGCLPSPMQTDTVLFVIPGFTTMEFPKSPKTRVKAYFGPQGQLHARDEFHRTVGQATPEADLNYMLIGPMVVYNDYAVVGVRRPVEQGGVVIDRESRGGAVYLMRRAGTGASAEWRLLAIVRSWGG
ncbi:MAG: hypothetical protein IBJ03_07440 [Gemmatimonadaceae bacterium]|nr:hypothetical protein [Gemmatimonadaceae bacterium]